MAIHVYGAHHVHFAMRMKCGRVHVAGRGEEHLADVDSAACLEYVKRPADIEVVGVIRPAFAQWNEMMRSHVEHDLRSYRTEQLVQGRRIKDALHVKLRPN